MIVALSELDRGIWLPLKTNAVFWLSFLSMFYNDCIIYRFSHMTNATGVDARIQRRVHRDAQPSTIHTCWISPVILTKQNLTYNQNSCATVRQKWSLHTGNFEWLHSFSCSGSPNKWMESYVCGCNVYIPASADKRAYVCMFPEYWNRLQRYWKNATETSTQRQSGK